MSNSPSLPVELLASEPPAPAARTKNTLTLANQLKLADWCRQYPDDCAKKTYPDLADIATAALKFTVTPANVSSTIEACGIERRKPDAPPSVEERLADLEAWKRGDGVKLHGTVETILAGLRALTERVNRLERIEEERDTPPTVPHPDLPGLPAPAFHAVGALHGLESAQ